MAATLSDYERFPSDVLISSAEMRGRCPSSGRYHLTGTAETRRRPASARRVRALCRRAEEGQADSLANRPRLWWVAPEESKLNNLNQPLTDSIRGGRRSGLRL